MEPVTDAQTVEHPQDGHPRHLGGKHAQHVPLAEANGAKHPHRTPPFAHVANGHHADARHTNQQTESKVALEQREDGENQGLDDHDLLSHRLNVDVHRGQLAVEAVFEFRRCSSLVDRFALWRKHSGREGVRFRFCLGAYTHVHSGDFAAELLLDGWGMKPDARGEDVRGLFEKPANLRFPRVLRV